MDLISQLPFRQALKKRYSIGSAGYFWDALEHLAEFGLSARVSWQRLADATASVMPALAGRPPFIIFSDRIAGWRGVRRRRWSPVRTSSIEEALRVVREYSYFRDARGYADNYYLCDRSLSWFIVFCHHDDWHIFVDSSVLRRQAFRRWQAKADVHARQRVQTQQRSRDNPTSNNALNPPVRQVTALANIGKRRAPQTAGQRGS